MPKEVESLRPSAAALVAVEEAGAGGDESSSESEGGEMEDDDEEEIPLDMEDVEAVSKKARQVSALASYALTHNWPHGPISSPLCSVYSSLQDEDLGTEHLQVLERLKANQRRDYMKVSCSDLLPSPASNF